MNTLNDNINNIKSILVYYKGSILSELRYYHSHLY